MIEEFVTYHAEVYRDFGNLSARAGKGNYLAGKGEVIARSSRILEPFMVEFVQRQVVGKSPLSMLEVGCGSGIYLYHAACASPQATGIGIDFQKEVIAETSMRLVEWGLAPRFRVMDADNHDAIDPRSTIFWSYSIAVRRQRRNLTASKECSNEARYTKSARSARGVSFVPINRSRWSSRTILALHPTGVLRPEQVGLNVAVFAFGSLVPDSAFSSAD